MNGGNEITCQRLVELLHSLGFIQDADRDGCTAFYHHHCESLLLLPTNRGPLARQADIASVGRHLIGHGHLDERSFADFVESGRLPQGTM